MNQKYFLSLLPCVLGASIACAADSSHTQQNKQVTQSVELFRTDAAALCRNTVLGDFHEEAWFQTIASMAGKEVNHAHLKLIVDQSHVLVQLRFSTIKDNAAEMAAMRVVFKDIIEKVEPNAPSISLTPTPKPQPTCERAPKPKPKRKRTDTVPVQT